MGVSPFAYVNAEKSPLYRAVMAAFVEAKRRFLVHLRPEDVADQVLRAAPQHAAGLTLEHTQAALDQLVHWGNLQANPDTSRVTSVEDFYRARYLYQLTREGEAAEIALAAYDEALGRRGALQAVALEDIRVRLRALRALAAQLQSDPARAHALLRDLSRVFADLAENAQSFMAGLGRTLELRSANREAFIAYKERLIGYLERFIGDLVAASAEIARPIQELSELPAPGTETGSPATYPGQGLDRLLTLAAEREAADAAPPSWRIGATRSRRSTSCSSTSPAGRHAGRGSGAGSWAAATIRPTPAWTTTPAPSAWGCSPSSTWTS